MFRKTLVKLTLAYLAIMMLISLFFSVALYQASVSEIDRDFGRQQDFFDRQLPNSLDAFGDRFLQDRLDDIKATKLRLVGQLVITNVIIVGFGGLVSYYLAMRTLRPIERAHAAQSRFTADASHELRTPLAVMQTEIEVTLMDPKLTLKDAKQQLKSNLEELARLTSLSEGLLRLSQLEDGVLDKKPIKAGAVIDAAMQRTGTQAKQKDITISFTSPKNLIVSADEPSLVEALVVLIDNAIKYSNPGAIIDVSARKDQKQTLFEVKDSGVGIEEKDIAHIFDRFYRADASRTNSESSGYGIGLAIAKNIVNLHGGSIDVKSKPGVGSNFFITLP